MVLKLLKKKIKTRKKDAEKFYKVHETKPFYNDLCEYLSSGAITSNGVRERECN